MPNLNQSQISVIFKSEFDLNEVSPSEIDIIANWLEEILSEVVIDRLPVDPQSELDLLNKKE